jgi:hypothetical protein
MDTQETKKTISIEELRKGIEENQALFESYLTTAYNMKWMAIGSGTLSIVFFVLGSVFSGIGFLVLCFFSVRKYNQFMGMAEVHHGVKKFLQFMLNYEISKMKASYLITSKRPIT